MGTPQNHVFQEKKNKQTDNENTNQFSTVSYFLVEKCWESVWVSMLLLKYQIIINHDNNQCLPCARAVEHGDYNSTEKRNLPNECPGYGTKVRLMVRL